MKSKLENYSHQVYRSIQKNEDDSIILKRIPFQQNSSLLTFKLAKLGDQEYGLENAKAPVFKTRTAVLRLPDIRGSSLEFKPGELESQILRKKYRGSVSNARL